MELRDLVRETRGLAPGALARKGLPFLLEEGRLRHETRRIDASGTRVVDPAKVQAELDDLTSDLSRRRLYCVMRRDGQRGETAIGRGAEADVRIELSSVSSVHAVIAPGAKGFTIKDSGSTNGTFVDGQKLDPGVPKPLASGSVVRFGPELRLTFLDGGAMEHLLRQLDPVLRRMAEDAATMGSSADHGVDMRRSEVLPDASRLLPSYLDEPDDEDAAPVPGVRGRRPAPPTEKLSPPSPLAVPAAGEPSSRTEVIPPRPQETTTMPRSRESPLAIECPPFPPVGLVTGVPVVVGRIVGNDLVLPHPQVSRQHACFERVEGGAIVRDLGSANGLWVQGKKVAHATLAVDGEVAIGPYKLRIAAVEAPSPHAGIDGATRASGIPPVQGP